MRTIFTILLISFIGTDLFPCNCPPPFPNLRDPGDTNYYKNYRIKNSNISGIVQVIGTQQNVRIIIDTIVCRKRYYDEIKAKNIDPKFTSLNKYLEEQSSQWEMRMCRAVLIKSYKPNTLVDTIYLFSDNSNCGIYFAENDYYEIYCSEFENKKYEIDNVLTSSVQHNVPRNSCFVSRCNAEYIDFEKTEK